MPLRDQLFDTDMLELVIDADDLLTHMEIVAHSVLPLAMEYSASPYRRHANIVAMVTGW